VHFREAFSGALDAFGFPPCPGNVMVRNPVWSQTVEGFIRQLKAWVLSRDPASAMNIAIFFDAVAVAGAPDLLARAKEALVTLMRGETALLAHFAHLIETFSTPNLGVLSTIMASVGVRHDEIDLKRVGIFPIVHGVRTLAIDKGVLVNPTAARIDALVQAGSLERKFGQDLTGALQVFMEFRLRTQLRALHRRTIGTESVVRLDEITTADRDMLRDALRIVRRFRELIRHRYNLGTF
jgi:CBS domain-containing protein